jgi:hypothetical protein
MKRNEMLYIQANLIDKALGFGELLDKIIENFDDQAILNATDDKWTDK